MGARTSAVSILMGGVMPVTFGEVGESTQNAGLRPAVAAMDSGLTRLAHGTPIGARVEIGEVLESWAMLVELLALGPAPEMRECPVCRHRGMRAATRCGFCWTALAPLAHAGGEPAAALPLDGG
jgi:hypothetical protein